MQKLQSFIIPPLLLLSLLVIASCKDDPAPPRAAAKPPAAAASTPTAPAAATTAPSSAKGEYTCLWTDQSIAIDGKADESAWAHAPVIDGFVIPWQAPDRRPVHATRAKLLWDRENLYFFADMDDSDLRADVKEHNGRVWEDDAFELFLKPAQDQPGYYEFEVNPLNTTFDVYFSRRGGGKLPDLAKAHPFNFQTAVSPRGQLGVHQPGGGWSVEGKIQWADLASTGGRPEVGEAWRFALCRVNVDAAKNKPELSTIASMKKPSFHQYEDYPLLRFAAGRPGTAKPYGIDHRIPWTTSRLAGYPEPPPRYTLVNAFPNLEKIHQPIFVTEEPGTDDLLVIQHLGSWAGPAKIIRVKDDPQAATSQTIYEANDITYCLCFDPKYAENGYLYLASNGPMGGGQPKDQICRYTMDRKTGKPDPASRRVIIEWESNGHNGAGMAFGPDGMLYITSGDTSSDSDRNNRGQDLTHLSSALLRIDVDHPADGKQYSIPKDNPFVGKPEFKDARPEIWAHGFRNPWRMSIDPKTGTIWIGQNGQDLWESVDAVEKGANYGWPVYEGSHPFHSHRKLETRTKLTRPTIEHHHSEARSLTGGVVYYGRKYPDLYGAYLYGDFSTGRIWAAKYDGRHITWHQEIARTSAQIINFHADKHGDIFVCDDSGGVWKLAPQKAQAAAPPFPTLLSLTGVFSDTAKHQPAPGLIPYDVNAPLWSDHAKKRRFIALPGDERIDYTAAHGWNFPDGAALVKTFSMEMEAGDPASERRLETRILLKQGQNWDGYTYIWNDAQTDAQLAPAAGKDQPLTIKDAAAPGGERQQIWHYPSRAECMACHSRAANFVLGPSQIQMNRDFDYGGARDNQLRTLEHLGVLKLEPPDARDQLMRDALGRGLPRHEAQRLVHRLIDTSGQRQRPATSSMFPHAPGQLTKLANPADPSQPLNLRARSYLHANCAQCHVEAGGGNASVDLDFAADASRTKMFDVAAQSDMGIPGAKLIAPGNPSKSMVLMRMAIRGTNQMPPLGTNVVDRDAVKLVEQWIAAMPANAKP